MATAAPPLHCADELGRIIALAADKHYLVRPPSAPQTDNEVELWKEVPEEATGTASNSFTGSYMQVFPDDRDHYNHITGYESFTMTGLEFKLRIYEPGVHSLFMRWTGGDTIGGGDSLYVVMYEAETGSIVPGVTTYTPKMISMTESEGRFAGCCYNPTNHACPCYETSQVQDQTVGPAECTRPQAWIPNAASSSARRRGFMCEVGHGQVSLISAPRWYLFAGQQYGNNKDFDSEPWDMTCQAEGVGTTDTGTDFAQWDLHAGDYRIVIYPREDGVAFDALYLTTPSNSAPPNELRLKMGGSTVTGCDQAPRVQSSPPMTRAAASQIVVERCNSVWDITLSTLFWSSIICSILFACFRWRTKKPVVLFARGNAMASAASQGTILNAGQLPSHYVPPA
ncbi:MAG: hypothetical protein SGPRY_012445 [Prymnesium sp.]